VRSIHRQPRVPAVVKKGHTAGQGRVVRDALRASDPGLPATAITSASGPFGLSVFFYRKTESRIHGGTEIRLLTSTTSFAWAGGVCGEVGPRGAVLLSVVLSRGSCVYNPSRWDRLMDKVSRPPYRGRTSTGEKVRSKSGLSSRNSDQWAET